MRYYAAVLERDPINPFVLTGYSTSLIAAGRTAQTVETARNVPQLSSNIEQGHWYLAYALLRDKLNETADEITLEPAASLRHSCEALIVQARNERKAVDASLRELLREAVAAEPPKFGRAVQNFLPMPT
ncbi:MAG: hypothetical protein JSR36_03130 [Proteobacteria bacterium]|nr:hypothetical protein [Pseudomonadota bacterium]